MASPKNVFLVWGAKGWIGGLVIDLLKQQGKTVHGTTARLHEQDHVRKELDEHKPTHVINCAGKTGIKNVDWCEDHKLETMESNGLGAFILAHECAQRNIHLTVAATGCK
jgi:dTDP-4-dehydrorhamnose reductase